ncbi:phosphatase PAP2 family protein [Arvimicrobium flavum]|uniref:phosphatase PAP2 family protein n=1 Tax=Arvimicrobium flavum TaxID=3393320 RepID=UPI00237B544D|nr:phosphatase PAP2 family protein [Mesorhizobium shangrilense]
MSTIRAIRSPKPAYAPEFARRLLGRIRDDAPLYLAIAAYTLAGLVFLTATGRSDLATYSTYLTKWCVLFLFLFPIIAFALHWAKLIHRFNNRRWLAATRVFAPDKVAYFVSGICLVMALMFFQGTFTSVKNGLSAWQGGFPYDRLLADLDAALYLGNDPWRLLYSVAKTDWFLSIVQLNYSNLWFIICFGALFYVATSPKAAAIRTRYILSFMLVWIVVGNLVAGTLLSAGPVYYGFVTGDSARFGEQVAFLGSASGSAASAAFYQDYLWDLHQKGITGFGSGISAFPSVHVGLITLNALFVWDRSRVLGALAFVYVAFVLMSSVYLAWHYSIDGYAAIALTVGIHYALRKWLPDAGRRGRASRVPVAAGGEVADASPA